MKIAIFGGSFNPVHNEHTSMVKSSIEQLKFDKVIVVPTYLTPNKQSDGSVSAEDRLNMVKLAFKDIEKCEVSAYEINKKGVSYTYQTVEYFAEKYEGAEFYFLLGSDMLRDFYFWKNPERILKKATLVVCRRNEAKNLIKKDKLKFAFKFKKDFLVSDYIGGSISSTDIRVRLAFNMPCDDMLNSDVLEYIQARKLYSVPEIRQGITYLKPRRKEHSYRVAKMAVENAYRFKLSERDTLLASGLHDLAKSVPLEASELKGFELEDNIPKSIIHQYAGAYMAKNLLKIKDEKILNAIKYHTSGRGNMTVLEKLVYLSDLLEDGRDFKGVNHLRKLFYKDMDKCLRVSLKQTVKYLKREKTPIYGLTLEAYKNN